MIKQFIHTEIIKENGVKRQFQVKLPRNAKSIVAIRITANPFDATHHSSFESEVGWIWLRLSERRDVFYADKLSTYKNNHNLSLPRLKEMNPFNKIGFEHHGKKEEFETVFAELDTNILEGYYIDRIYSKIKQYKLRIYLKLEI
tara:strand:+ start:2993 stop:3424 length:432 start_codon:yes stop_codon:yes gene_type:complete